MYTKAILRKPGKNYTEGITTSNLGKADFKKAIEQHDEYCSALVRCGVELIILEADENFPDGCFVEDTAIITEKLAIITRPGALTRRGEEVSISEILMGYRKIKIIQPPGILEGGDILRVNDHYFIGISGRTNKEGAHQFAAILSEFGYSSSEVKVETVPHLKSGITYPGKGNFIAIDEFAEKFNTSKIIRVHKDETYSANCLAVNDFLLISKGFPESKRKFAGLGYNLIELEMSEFRKMDGALTCLSLLL